MEYFIIISILISIYCFFKYRRKKIVYIKEFALLKPGTKIKIMRSVPLIDEKGQGMRYLLVDEIVEIKSTIINPILRHECYLVNVHGEIGTMNPAALAGQELLHV